VKEIEFTGRGNSSLAAELFGELAILDLKLLERLEFTNVEAPAGGWRWMRESALYFSSDVETATSRAIPDQIEIMREGQFQAPNLRRPPRTNKYLLMGEKRGG
jgi:hypothetical protein